MESCIDHSGVFVSDLARSRAFYEAAFAPLEIRLLKDYGVAMGFGRKKPDFWVTKGPASYQRAEDLVRITPMHFAFSARSRAEVDAFYAAALAAGGRDFGPPGVRTLYHPGYYGAFVLDPDGHNIEAVIHGG